MAFAATGENQREIHQTVDGPTLCDFDFYRIDECHMTVDQQRLTVSINTMLTSEHERQLTHVVVNNGNDTFTLPFSQSVSIMPGDRGYILVEDINFDKHPDIAVSTSFGVANPYLDYWVTSENAEHFHHIGHFPRLKVDSDTHTLSATVRVNAATYENKKWRWENRELVRVRMP